MATKTKRLIEVTLMKCELTGIPEKGLLKSRNLGTVDMIWPRSGIARRSASRLMVFSKGKADFTGEEWAKRVLFREEVDGHTAFAVSIMEPVSVQQVRRFFSLAAKYALKQGADFVESAMMGYGDIASAPADALAAMVGEKNVPKAIAQGVVDLPTLPKAGEEMIVTVPLARPRLFKNEVGALTLRVCG